MKHLLDSNSKPRFTPSKSLLLSTCTSVLFLAGCSGFMGPDARMGRPDPQLLSSRGGQLPQPGTLGTEQPTSPASRSYSTPKPFDPARSATSPETKNPYITNLEPFDEDFDSSPDMDEDFDGSPPMEDEDVNKDADEGMLPSVPDTSPALSHRVRKGESLWVISRKYDISVDELASYNDIGKDDILRAGAVLDIPPGGTPPAGDQETAPSTQNRNHGSEASSSTTSATAATPVAKKDMPEDGKYIVRSGDSLWKISRRFGVSINDLRDWNDLDSDVLQIGRVILLSQDANQAATDTDNATRTPQGLGWESNWGEDDAAEEQNGSAPAETADLERDADNTRNDAGMEAVERVDFPQTLDHTVGRTDTLQSIAAMYETSVTAIKQANPTVQDNDDLEYGMKLVIPFE